MARPHLSVTKAKAVDAGTLATLWIESALVTGMSHDLAARAANAGRIREALARPGTSALLATLDGRPVGFVVVNTRNQGLIEPAALAIDELYVVSGARRQGVAAALLGGVAKLAESQGHDVIFANVSTTDKLSNRFFARLGFTSTVTRRAVPTSVLRRKLAGSDAAARDVLLGKRRTLRARAGIDTAQVSPRLTLRRPAAG